MPPTERSTFANCCLLSTAALDVRKGTSHSCPQFREGVDDAVLKLEDSCGRCPVGTCRVGSRCYCPEDFFRSDEQKRLCVASFGKEYPDSIGLLDKACPSNPVPEHSSSSPASTPQPSQNSDPTQTPNPTASATPTEDSGSASNKTETDVSNAEGEAADEEGDDEDGLTKAEIAGIVIASVVGAFTILGVIHQVRR